MKWSSPQCVAALSMLFSGAVLCYIAYFLSENKDVPDGALWYLGQVIVFAGSVFGLKGYTDSKYIKFKNDIKQEIQNEISEMKR